MWILAQADPNELAKGVDVIERVSRGSVAFILLVLLVVAIVGFVWQYRRNNEIEDKHREDMDARSRQDKADAAKLLADMKAEADKVRGEQLALMRERLQAEREADATMAAAVRTIDRDAAVIERAERLMDRLERKLT